MSCLTLEPKICLLVMMPKNVFIVLQNYDTCETLNIQTVPFNYFEGFNNAKCCIVLFCMHHKYKCSVLDKIMCMLGKDLVTICASF